MSSRKLLVRDFIYSYFRRWGESPTLGEISASLHISKKRAHELVHQLASERAIEVIAGKTRGIRLIDRTAELSDAEVLERLRQMGAIVDRDFVAGVTDKGLPLLPFLDVVREEAPGTAPHTNPAVPGAKQRAAVGLAGRATRKAGTGTRGETHQD